MADTAHRLMEHTWEDWNDNTVLYTIDDIMSFVPLDERGTVVLRSVEGTRTLFILESVPEIQITQYGELNHQQYKTV